jgi:glycosyltransferase involved in cell wall biosynthesis
MRKKILVVSFPVSKAFLTPLLNLIEVMYRISNGVYVITGGIEWVSIRRREKFVYYIYLKETKKILTRILRYIYLQIKLSLLLINLSRNYDVVIFFMESGAYLPAVVTKLLRKRIILLLPSLILQTANRESFINKIFICLQSLSYKLSDRIVVYSPRLIIEWNLKKYEYKILFAHEHFLNFASFTTKKRVSERENIIGYIGRLSKEKGVLNLVKAVPLILKCRKDVYFYMCGDGELLLEINDIIRGENLNRHLKIEGWVSHGKLPDYLNCFKLVVLPSYTEGLPNVMLEAMACGAPVLVSPVGAIPDVIKDGGTGFLLKSNDPKHIADKIIELLNKPELLEKVSINAYNYVRENFSYEKTLETWRKIIREVEA